MMRTHEVVSDNHLRFANQLMEMVEQLTALGKEIEKARKTGKEMGVRLDKTLADSEASMEKARQRFETSVEELERCLVAKAGESTRSDPSLLSHAGNSTMINPSLVSQQQGTQNIQQKRTFGKAMSKLKASSKTLGTSSGRNEEELRARTSATSDAYRAEVQACQAARRDHWTNNVPRVIRSLKESSDEVDNGTQYHLLRYAQLYEHMLVQDGITIAPASGSEQSPGLRGVIECIDNRDDFKRYMEHFNVAWSQTAKGSKGPASRGDGMLDEGGYIATSPPAKNTTAMGNSSRRASTMTTGPYMNENVSALDAASLTQPVPPSGPSKTTFGVSLTEQMTRDDTEIPRILEECIAVIEAHGKSLLTSFDLEWL